MPDPQAPRKVRVWYERKFIRDQEHQYQPEVAGIMEEVTLAPDEDPSQVQRELFGHVRRQVNQCIRDAVEETLEPTVTRASDMPRRTDPAPEVTITQDDRDTGNPGISEPPLTMPFGKHKGVPVDQVPNDYWEWALRNAQPFKTPNTDTMKAVVEYAKRKVGA